MSKKESKIMVDNDPVLLKINAARVIASSKQPYFSTALFAMVPIRTNEIPTMATDSKWRLYFADKFVNETSVEHLAAVLLHEVGHCIRGHSDRFAALKEPVKRHPSWNYAGDSLINEDLKEDGLALPDFAVYIKSLTEAGIEGVTREMSTEQIYSLIRVEAEKACTCNQPKPQDKKDKGDKSDDKSDDQSDKGEPGNDQSDKGEPGNDQSEPGDKGNNNPNGTPDPNATGDTDQIGDGNGNYTGNETDPKGKSGGNSGRDTKCPVHGDHEHSHDGQSGDGSGEACPDCSGIGNGNDGGGDGSGIKGWDCGSAADGIPRDYEAEGDKIDKGVDGDRADLLRQHTAVEITQHSKNRGTVPSGYLRWAKELLDPTIDWRKELASIIRRDYARVAGQRDYSYARPSRRNAAIRQSGQKFVLPAMRQPAPPKIAIVIDTSGSMSDEMLQWALAETQGVLRSLGSSSRSLSIISCDANAHVQRVNRIEDVKLIGGGGTDMRVGIRAAVEAAEKPDAVIVVSDTFTPWPDEEIKGVTLIVAATDDSNLASIPDFMRTVVVIPD